MDRLRLLDGSLKLRHLALVDALKRHGSVSNAADALHITQPAATRTLRELESILGVPLYERGPRGVTPTIFGDAFTEHARAILAQLSQADRRLAQLAGADCATLIVGSCLAGSNTLLLHAIARLKRENPALMIAVREASPEALSGELEAGRIDLIVGPLKSRIAEVGARAPLYEETAELFTHAEHPLGQRSRIELTDLGDYAWIIPSAETVLRQEMEQLFACHDMPLPENRIEVTSFLSARQLLLKTDETDLVALLPSSIGRDEPRLRALPIGLDMIRSTVGITMATSGVLSPGAKALTLAFQTIAAECSIKESKHPCRRSAKPSERIAVAGGVTSVTMNEKARRTG
jgi:DNA-binding transcriptional LysR family regulator